MELRRKSRRRLEQVHDDALELVASIEFLINMERDIGVEGPALYTALAAIRGQMHATKASIHELESNPRVFKRHLEVTDPVPINAQWSDPDVTT